MSLTGIGFLAVYGLGLLLSFKHPLFGLFSYMWAFYNDPVARWWGEGLPDLRWSLVSAVVTTVAVLLRHQADESSSGNGWAKRNDRRDARQP